MLTPISEARWNEKTARHLLNRAGFGIPRERVRALAAMTPSEAVASFVDFESVPSGFSPPDFLVDPSVYYEIGSDKSLTDAERRKAYTRLRMRENGIVQRMRGWWLERMAETPRPLEEKLVLFWHGHFAVSARKVSSSYANFHLNDTFRKHAAGNFRELTTLVGQSPAMLRYLDNQRNVKEHPNENWARELMELFTLGPGHYTEQDIKESARAFTGWAHNKDGFTVRKWNHDTGSKRFMGRAGNFDGYDILRIIFDHPATAKFIAEKLWTFFAYEKPEPAIVNGLAARLRDHGYALRPMLRTMLLSEAFYSEKAIGSRIKSPVEFTLQASEDLGLEDPPYVYMARYCANLGQNLFFPPNVKGWDGGRAWINANALMDRYNFPLYLIAAAMLGEDDEGQMEDMGAMSGTALANRMRELLKDEPHAVRRKYMEEFFATPKGDRRDIVLQALNHVASDSLWRIERSYHGISYGTAEATVDELATRMLGRPLTETQRAVLAKALHPAGGSPPRGGFSKDGMRAALHLLMSMAEYQLC